ncbi:MAG: hypothetical protein LBM12_03205 [Candidatus Nomurabacteria bacterium]|jgi:hypothetical protein|nr:hypothetical protein [Candidatus Nomurabacteria bacterium]
MKKLHFFGTAALALSILSANLMPLTAFADDSTSGTLGCAETPLVEGTSICLPNAAERLILAPGQEITRSFSVKNSGSTTYSLEVTPDLFLPSADAGERFSHDGAFTEIRRWISVDRSEYRNIAPGETIIINYAINTPASAPAGAQYAGINIKTMADGTSAMVAQKQLQFRIFAQVSGDTIERGEVVAFDIPQWVKGGSLNTSLSIRNSGNTDYVSANTLIVKSLFGREVYRSPATNDTNIFLYPQSEPVSVELNYIEPRFGLYYVTQQSVFPNGEIIEHTKLVLVAPVWMVAVFFVGLGAIIILVGIAVATRIAKSRRFAAE